MPKVIGILVLEKNVLKGFTIYGHVGHLGHVTKTLSPNPKELGSIGPVVPEEEVCENID